LPHTPPPAAARQAAILPRVTELPSVTTTTPPGGLTDDDAPPTLGTIIVTEISPPNVLTVGLTPEHNPAVGKPVLEIVGMPTWLWIEGLPPAIETTLKNGHVITDFVVLDKVVWNTGTTTGPIFSCGNGTSSPSPGKGYGVPYDIAFDPTANGVPNACVNTFSSPYYSTSGGATTASGAGIYNLQATVSWHIAYTVFDGKTTTGPTRLVGTTYSADTPTSSTQVRVGEIQALASSP